MFHIVGVTPEASALAATLPEHRNIPSIDIEPRDLRSCWTELNTARDEPVDLVSLGNPHFSFSEIANLASLCSGRVKHPDVVVMATTGRATHDRAAKAGLVAELEAFGVRFVTDTCWCMIGAPLIPPGAGAIMTNSGKYAHYGPGLTGRRFYFGSLAACVATAVNGAHHGEIPQWMRGK